jgi:signal peptidase II
MATHSAQPTVLGTAALVVAIDQVTKEIALRALAGRPVDLIPGALTLRLTFNSGGAFGILRGRPTLFLIATIAVAAAILLWAGRLQERSWAVPLGLILGGGLGNLADRLFRPLGGQVVDFIDVHVWPVFNLADSAIVVGVCLLFLLSGRSRSAAQGAPGSSGP